MTNTELILILTAAGSSTRMGLATKKEYLPLNGGTVLSCSASVFLNTAHFSKIIITCPKDRIEEGKNAFFKDENLHRLTENCEVVFVYGDDTRQKSVFNALEKAMKIRDTTKQTFVFIHDGARPFVTEKIILDSIENCIQFGSCVPAINPVDTLKQKDSNNNIEKHLNRSQLCCVQTPQCFELETIYNCHQKAKLINKEYTDDTEIWDSFPEITNNRKVHIIDGDKENIKITYKQDIENHMNKTNFSQMRIGFGTDLHELVEGRDFYLGGIKIPSKKGEKAHSDGDVLLHAICDSLLGACGLGDIGSYFPDTDEKYKNANSADLLRIVWKDVQDLGYTLNNMDCVLEFESPKFLPWKQQVIESIASILNVDKDKIYVKAKTNEKLDAIGEGKAIKAYCTSLLCR